MRLAVYLLIFYFLGLLVLTVPALLNTLDLDGLVIVGMAISLLICLQGGRDLILKSKPEDTDLNFARQNLVHV